MVVMAIDFPDSPQVNQQFVAAGTSYIWTGFVWRAQSANPTASPTFTGTTNTYYLNVLNDLGVTGSTSVRDLNVDGNLTIAGTTTTVSATNLEISDPLIYMGQGNVGNVNDLGIVGHFNDGTYQHTGLVRDASDNKWKLFKGLTVEPTSTIDFTSTSLDTLAVGSIEASTATIGGATFTGNITFAQGATVTGGATLTLPAQSGNSGKFLKTDGTVASWQTVDALPTQTGNSGKYLTTNGTTSSWQTVGTLPTQTGNSGKFLTTDGTTASWGSSLSGLTMGGTTFTKNATVSTDGSIVFDNGTTDTPGIKFYYANNTNFGIDVAGTALRFVYKLDETGGLVGAYMDSSGNFTAVGDITTNSDLRLKTNIKTLDNALYKVTKLEGVTYNLKADPEGRGHTGLIAQDVQDVIPEAVIENEDGIKSVAYGNLVGLLVEAIKEQQVQINELRSKLDGI
jgi:hypothetical protein